MSEEKKHEYVKLFEYNVTKDGRKVLKLTNNPNADDRTKELVAKVRAAIGGDFLSVNLYSDEFRQKYNIQDWKRGTIDCAVSDTGKNGSTEVDF